MPAAIVRSQNLSKSKWADSVTAGRAGIERIPQSEAPPRCPKPAHFAEFSLAPHSNLRVTGRDAQNPLAEGIV
jgi:hypothetical protein